MTRYVRYVPDPNKPRGFTAQERARLEAMTDEEIEANALSDPDNPPTSDASLERARKGRFIRMTREGMGLTQEVFAKNFRLTLGRLRDLEQGRTEPDGVVMAYFALIREDAKRVEKVVGSMLTAEGGLR